MAGRPTRALNEEEPNKRTKKSWWKTILSSAGLLSGLLGSAAMLGLIMVVQIVFGDGAYWQWQQGDFETGKLRIHLYDEIHKSVAQALQLGREQKDACFFKEMISSQAYYAPRSDSEKEETGCHEKEKSLDLLNESIKVHEEQLAELENRKPRKLTVEVLFPLPAPTNLRGRRG